MQEVKLGHMTLQIIAGSIQHTINAFLLERRSRNLSPNTLVYYGEELKLFGNFLDSLGITMLEQLTAEDIRRYMVALSERRNGGGCHAAFRSIRAMLLWAWEEYEIAIRNPIGRVSPPKKSNQILPGVPLEDVSAMVAACQGDNLAKRDKAILLTLLDTGARASELTAWKITDLDVPGGALEILHGKGDKRRTVYIGKITRRAVMAYLRTRKEITETSPLFATDDGEKFSNQGLRRMVEKRAKQAVVKTPGLHDFRRTFALEMLRSGVDVYSLQRLMGHSDLSVLRRYLAQTDEDLEAAHARFGPVQRLNI